VTEGNGGKAISSVRFLPSLTLFELTGIGRSG